MILYLSIIAIAVIMLSLLNIFFSITSLEPLTTFLMTSGIAVYEFCQDGIVAFLIHLLPASMFDINKKIYNVSNRERKFYEKIKIRKWKDKVWELGSIGGFSKKNLQSGTDKSYLSKFLMESNKGVMVHIISCFTGFTALLIFPIECALSITLPVAIVNLLMNLPSLFILRYNTPKLMALYKRAMRTPELKNSETTKVNDEEKLPTNDSAKV